MKTSLFALLICCLNSACSNSKSELLNAALGFNRAKVFVVNSSVTAPVSYTVTEYDQDGNYVGILIDYTAIGANIRGIAPYDSNHVILSLENLDRLDKVNLIDGSSEIFAANGNFSGTIQDIAISPSGDYYVLETNTIERFDKNGIRFGATATPYISTVLTTGGVTCTLSTPRKIVFNSSGMMIVSNTGNSTLNVYDVSTTAPTCVSTNNTQGAVTPVALLAHTDGNIYQANNLAANSRIVRFNATVSGAAATVWNTNLTIISTPTALAELPDQSILVASDATDAIERIDVNGFRVGTNSFIRNALTGNVVAIYVLKGQ